mmetsp:Transcript_28043/g.74163  ORF Transcript_28043/g.74163 Transcript_28043/m.74163 type:complete len:258 (+) Transcript_28043:446-1219(+)
MLQRSSSCMSSSTTLSWAALGLPAAAPADVPETARFTSSCQAASPPPREATALRKFARKAWSSGSSPGRCWGAAPNLCGRSILSSSARGLSGSARKQSQMILGRAMKSSTSQSPTIAVRLGATCSADWISDARSETASKIFPSRTKRAPISQLSSQSSSCATRPALLQRWGSTRSRHPLTFCRYARMAPKDSTTSAARMCAAPRAFLPAAPAASARCRIAAALSRMSTLRSSRPLPRKFATEFRCATHAARRRCSSR